MDIIQSKKERRTTPLLFVFLQVLTGNFIIIHDYVLSRDIQRQSECNNKHIMKCFYCYILTFCSFERSIAALLLKSTAAMKCKRSRTDL